MDTTSRRRTVAVLALVYGTAALLVASGFVLYRIYSRHATFKSRDFFWIGEIHEDASMGLRMRPESTGFAVLNHGLHDPARRIAVHTDSNGCRVPIGTADVAVQRGGIAAIGCSCTFGHGVAAESSYVAQAGRLLGVPSYNLGVCGYSSITSLLRLQEEIGTLRPRWVVYGFGNFHLERSGRAQAETDVWQAYARCDNGRCRIVPPPFDNRLVFASVPHIESLYYAPRLAGRPTPLDLQRLRVLMPLALQDLGRSLNPVAWRLRFERPALPDSGFYRFLLGELQQTCRKNGAALVLLWFPAAFGEQIAPGMRAAVEAQRGDADFVYVDCSPPLFAGVRDQADYAARWQVPRDGHPNRFMHLEMARALAAALDPARR